ncbi:MAG: hypothetical protein MN733_05130 [Nitrososphaera sp.]|nr:hypothetical protein [Nitrososphaera sp.]
MSSSDKKVTISAPLMQEIYNLLITRPYTEVAHLIKKLHDELMADSGSKEAAAKVESSE